MLALLAVLYLYVLPHRGESTAKAQTPALQEAGAPAASHGPHPLAKHLEISGVRIQEGKSGKAKIEFVVINHSGADLPRMTMDVSLRSADKEYFTFPVNLPSLGPFELKELSETVTTELKPYELPDWQFIRPQFTIRAD